MTSIVPTNSVAQWYEHMLSYSIQYPSKYWRIIPMLCVDEVYTVFVCINSCAKHDMTFTPSTINRVLRGDMWVVVKLRLDVDVSLFLLAGWN